MATEVFVYDEIGPDWLGLVSAKSIVDQMAKAKGGPVAMRINSPGGDVNEALAIVSAMQKHPAPVEVSIDGLAASAASLIAMAAAPGKLSISKHGLMMIHNGWTVTVGDIAAHLKTVEVLRTYGQSIVGIYADRTKKTPEEIQAMLDAETWLTAEQAKSQGFVDTIYDGGQAVAACVKPGRYMHTPAALLTSELPRERDRRIREQAASTKIRLTKSRFSV